MEIKAPDNMNFHALNKFLKKRNKATKKKYSIIRHPCYTCVTLPMCKNKTDIQILTCPLLYPIFYKIALALDYSSVEQNEITRLDPLNISFWIQRDSVGAAHVDVIRNGQLEFIGMGIEFDKGDIKNEN